MYAINSYAPCRTAAPTSQRGVTLIELLIAMSIFTVISAAVFVSMRSAVDSYANFMQLGKRESAVQSTVAILTQDLLQIVPRVTRGVAGQHQPAFMLKRGDYLLEFSRSGLPLESTTSGLQRIAYDFKGGSLARYTWAFMDLLPITTRTESVLIEGIKGFTVKVFDEKLDEHDSWPPLEVKEDQNLLLLPNGIQIIIDLEQGQTIERFLPGVSNVFWGEPDQVRQNFQSLGPGDSQ